MKDKLMSALGRFGFILFYVIMLLFIVAPLVILDLPYWAAVILIFIIFASSYIGGIVCVGLYIWAIVHVFTHRFDIVSLIFLVIAALYFLIFVIPPTIHMFSKSDDQ